MRFTLRDLFWLTLVVAMALGWWVNLKMTVERLDRLERDRGRLNSRIRELERSP